MQLYNNNSSFLYHKNAQPSFTKAIAPALPSDTEQLEWANRLKEIGFNLNSLACKDSSDIRELYGRLKIITNEVGKKAGFRVKHETPRMLQTDAYYVSSNFYIHQDAKDKSVYQIAFRRELLPWMKDLGLEKKDSRLVFYGLQQIMNEVLHDPVTREEIEEADKFFKTARNGWQYKWDRGMWEKILSDNDGIIPVKIEALPDGSTVFPGEPVIQIKAENGFGELAAWFETKLLQVWANSERASMLRHWLEYNKKLVSDCSEEKLTDQEITTKAQRMLVDFSDRSSMTPQESEWLGMGSLTVFPTTSTLSAIYQAYKANGDKMPGSIAMPSLPHRVVESYKDESDAYKALYNFTKGGLGSYVADCYNFRNAVKSCLIPLAIKANQENKELGINTIIHARPDSGDPYEEVKFVLDEAVKAGLYKEITAKDGKKLKAMTVLKSIQADGMSFKKMMEINAKLIEAGYSPPDCLAYGVGGFLHDSLSRSNMSAAQKLAEVGLEQRNRPTMKCPVDAPEKESIPGEVKIVREGNNEPTVRKLDESGENKYIVWFDGINGRGIEYEEKFSKVQQRVLKDFMSYDKPDKIYSQAIEDQKTAIRSMHHNN